MCCFDLINNPPTIDVTLDVSPASYNGFQCWQAAVAAEATFSLLDQDHKPVGSGTTRMVDFSKFRLLSYGFKYFIRSQELERSEFLNDNCFAVSVDVHIFKQAPAPPMALVHRLTCTAIEFLVGGETFTTHRLVLRARSPVFKAELSVPTMTKEDVATNAAVIEIEDMEAPVFRAMLAFIYTDTWPDMDGQDETAMAQRLLAAADRYVIWRLKLMCEDRMCEDRLCSHIDTGSVAAILVLAEKHRCAVLKKACLEFLGSAALFATMGIKELESLALSCPTITKELICNVIARNKEKGKTVGWNNQESN